MTIYLLLYIGSYLLGGIPFGVIAARAKGVDIMSLGSGNIGATNVMRVLGRGLGLTVFALDVLKGAIPAVAALAITGSKEHAFLCGMIAVLGHSLSPFLGFKGGKGVSTGLGALLGSAPLVGLSAFVVFLICLVLTRFVSLSSLAASTAMVGFGVLYGEPVLVVVGYVVLTVIIFFRHRDNIHRLLRGSERKFTFGAANGAERPATTSRSE